MGQRHRPVVGLPQVELTAADVAAGCVPFLHADDPGTLAGQTRAQDARRALACLRT